MEHLPVMGKKVCIDIDQNDTINYNSRSPIISLFDAEKWFSLKF
jgi:hypothetical protein